MGHSVLEQKVPPVFRLGKLFSMKTKVKENVYCISVDDVSIVEYPQHSLLHLVKAIHIQGDFSLIDIILRKEESGSAQQYPHRDDSWSFNFYISVGAELYVFSRMNAPEDRGSEKSPLGTPSDWQRGTFTYLTFIRRTQVFAKLHCVFVN